MTFLLSKITGCLTIIIDRMYKNTRIGTATILSIKIQCREIFLSKYISCIITMTVTRKGEMNTITVLFCTIYIQIDQNFRYSFDTTT